MMRLLLNRYGLIIAGFVFFSSLPVHGVVTRIISPGGGFTTEQTQLVTGQTDVQVKRATLLVNGIPQDVPVFAGKFSVKVVVSPGMNIIELKTDFGTDTVSFYAEVPRRDIKMVLTWDNARYVDLWVTDPSGERCYWANPWTKSGANLVANDETGFGPQIYTMQRALSGNYAVQVQFYSPGNAPVTRVKLYIVLYEGTSREKTYTYPFIMTKEHQIYHITDLFITGKNE